MNRKRLAKQPDDSVHPVRKYGAARILDLEARFNKNQLAAEEFSCLLEIYQVGQGKKNFVEYYDIKEDPVVEYYIEKIKMVADNQRFQKVMKQLTMATRQGGYRFGAPKTPFGHLLQSLQVKLKPLDRKDLFERAIVKLRDSGKQEQRIVDLMQKLNQRINIVCPRIQEDLEKDEEDLKGRLEKRKAQIVMQELRNQLAELDLSHLSTQSRDTSPAFKRLSILTLR
jgi:hypothetical protein